MDAQRPLATQHTSAPTPSATKSKYVYIITITMHASQNLERAEQPASRPHPAGFSHHPLDILLLAHHSFPSCREKQSLTAASSSGKAIRRLMLRR